MLTIERKYKIGYRPYVCTVSCDFVYIKKNDLETYNRLKMANRHREKDKLVNTLHVKEILTTLDDDNNIPTKKMKIMLAKRIWRVCSLKGSLDDYSFNIKNIKVVLNHGKVSYQFDETVH